MPEAPEVETVRLTLAPALVGHTLGRPRLSGKEMRVKAPDTRAFAALQGGVVDGLVRKGKLLVIDVDGGRGLLVHLGMSGRLTVDDAATPLRPHTHVVFPLDDGARELRFVDPRRFGAVVPFLVADARARALAALGPDPVALARDDVRDAVVARLKATRRAIKDALLDQRTLAGMGNIYVCEALFHAGVDPRTRASSLSRARLVRVVDACRAVIADGIAHGGTTLRDYVDGNGQAGRHQHHLAVFQREGEPCPSCGAKIRRVVQGARSTYFCPRCQPPSRTRRGG